MESFQSKRKSKGKLLGLSLGLGLAAFLGVGVAMAAGGDTPADPKPGDPPPPPKLDPQPPKGDEVKLDLPVPPGSLSFDLSGNWGGIPWDLRKELARMELASGEDGVARALAVKAWQAYRALLPYVSTAEAAKIAAAHPELCRLCFNPGDAGDSKKLLDANLKQGWPVPADVAGVEAGSYGVFDLLGASAVHAGIHTDLKSWLPLPKEKDFAAAMRRYDVQGFVATYMVRRIMYSEKYKVLRPGAQAAPAVQDSFNTWGNIFSAFAGPDNYAQGNQASIDAKTRYLARAKEIGIDLSKVAYPWPPGKSYAAPGWTAKQVWDRLQDFKARDVVDVGGEQAPVDENGIIPTSNELTQAERDACETVLALQPQPTSYEDGQGRIWTPCVSWWVGKNIPNWPAGVWPGQVPYLYKPADAADWLGCIAGYLVYKAPLAEAAMKNFPNEAATVKITKLLAARRILLRAHMTKRLAEQGRPNAPTACDDEPPAEEPPPADLNALMKLPAGLQARIVDQGGPNSPMLLVLHGRNADDTQLRKLVPADLPARIVFLRADGIGTGGYRWFAATSGAPPFELGPQIGLAADKVLLAMNELDLQFSPPKIYAFGYSQGAAVAYELAARDAVAGVVIAAGFLPAPRYPKGMLSTKVWAVHGAKDELVLVGNGTAAYEAFVMKANPKGITIVAGGTHDIKTLAAAVKADLKAMVVA